jgi:hypothetical protein
VRPTTGDRHRGDPDAARQAAARLGEPAAELRRLADRLLAAAPDPGPSPAAEVVADLQGHAADALLALAADLEATAGRLAAAEDP